MNTQGALPPRLRSIIMLMAERAQSVESPLNSFELAKQAQTITVTTSRNPAGEVVSEPELGDLVSYGLLEELRPRAYAVTAVGFEYRRQLTRP